MARRIKIVHVTFIISVLRISRRTLIRREMQYLATAYSEDNMRTLGLLFILSLPRIDTVKIASPILAGILIIPSLLFCLSNSCSDQNFLDESHAISL
jgi:hypothetical protein